jgi:5-methyltetrahydrofolate--homocysteine methyltransferase
MGGYDEKPEDMDGNEVFFKNEWLNMVGGCCGSLLLISRPSVSVPRNTSLASFDVGRPKMWLSGLEDMKVEDQHNHLGMPS